jgi:hypothetical protein
MVLESYRDVRDEATRVVSRVKAHNRFGIRRSDRYIPWGGIA